MREESRGRAEFRGRREPGEQLRTWGASQGRRGPGVRGERRDLADGN